MKLSVHLNFAGDAAEAFGFYADVFGAAKPFLMTWDKGPEGSPRPPGWGDKIMHASVDMGSGILMGCDAPPGSSKPMGGFQVSVESGEESEVRRMYESLREGGSVQMPLSPTFWSPLFGMCTDRFGVAWMVGLTAPAAGA